MQEFKFWPKLKKWQKISFLAVSACLGIFLLLTSFYLAWEQKHTGLAYPGVKIDERAFGGKSQEDIRTYFLEKNSQIPLQFNFVFEKKVATLSARQINWGYNADLLATQAIFLGRSDNLLSNLYQKINLLKTGYDLPLSYTYDPERLTSFLEELGEKINIAPKEALFRFENGRVTAFQPSSSGRALDIEKAIETVYSSLALLKGGELPNFLEIQLSTVTVEPEFTTEKVNNLGIKELFGRGTSYFRGSIPNRIHNIQLAAGRLNGLLIPTGKDFSFNEALGDVSKFTGYKEAYVIKDGRTVLGDGGGVCQVSTTFFRALLNAGLPLLERHPHSYRVGYYEQGSPVGLDASVYAPSWDLKFKNDTASYLLIQSFVDLKTSVLTFELYGASDGRVVVLSKPAVSNEVPPPEDLYQDDPNLPKGEIKQIDWKAWGADVSFSRTVRRGGQVLISETFSSHYRPWQAVFLRGTKE